MTRIRLMLSLLLTALAASNPVHGQIQQTPTDPWRGPDLHTFKTVPPSDVGLSRDALNEAAKIAEEGKSDSFVVVRGGKMAFQKYWNGKNASDLQQMYSATKSPFAFVVGRAIQKGYIESLDQPIVELVQEAAGKGREALTFRNIMAMASGLEQSAAMDREDSSKQLSQLEAALARSVTKEPLTRYHYNNAGYRLLFTALERASGKSIPELTREELFEPLGMQGAYWVELHGGGELKGYQSIRMRPADLAKVGQVMLNGGMWGGERYLSEDFIRDIATCPAPETNPSYALFWHLNSGDFYLSYADSDRMEGNLMPGTPNDALMNYGSRGQLIVAIPSLDLVWVRTGSEIPSTLWEKDSFVTKLSAAVIAAIE